MSAAKKPRTPSRNPQSRQIEFTPGQMIIAICTLIAFGLVCFMLGVLVNKMDTSFGPEATVATGDQAQPEPPDETPPAQRQQISPLPPESLQDRVASRNETDPGQPRTVPPPSATRRPAVPERTQTQPPTAPLEPDTDDQAETTPAEPPVEQAERTPEPEPEDEPESPPTLIENEAPITPDPETESTPEPPASAGAAGETAYGVQIASLSAEREEQAERALADAERAVSQSGQLVRTDDGRFFRLIIGEFESRADAARLQESMREQSRFEGCFVQSFTRR